MGNITKEKEHQDISVAVSDDDNRNDNQEQTSSNINIANANDDSDASIVASDDDVLNNTDIIDVLNAAISGDDDDTTQVESDTNTSNATTTDTDADESERTAEQAADELSNSDIMDVLVAAESGDDSQTSTASTEEIPEQSDAAEANDVLDSTVTYAPFKCDDLIDDTEIEEIAAEPQSEAIVDATDITDKLYGDNTAYTLEPQQYVSETVEPVNVWEAVRTSHETAQSINEFSDIYKAQMTRVAREATGRRDTLSRTVGGQRRAVAIAFLLPIIAIILCCCATAFALNELILDPTYSEGDDALVSVDLDGERSISITIDADGITDDDLPFLVRIYGSDTESVYGYTDTIYTTVAVYAGETVSMTMDDGDYTVEIVGAPMRDDGTIYSIGDSDTCTLSVGEGSASVTLSSQEDDVNWDVRGVIKNYNLYVAADIDDIDLEALREAALAVCEALDEDFELDGDDDGELTDEEIQSIIDELYAEAEEEGIANAESNASNSESTGDTSSSTSESDGSADRNNSSSGSTSSGNVSGSSSSDTSSGSSDDSSSDGNDSSSGSSDSNIEGGNSSGNASSGNTEIGATSSYSGT